jgi:hypothetical protein
MSILKQTLTGLVLTSLCFACDTKPKQETETATDTTKTDTNAVMMMKPEYNVLSAAEQSEGYKLLFDGKTLTGFHSYLKDSATGWIVENEAIVCPGKTGADLVTNEEYENFELSFEWKVEPKGNSGLIYKVIEDKKYKNTYESGPEYQIIDDEGYPDKLKDVQKSGANYDMQAPSKAAANTPGTWNKGKLIVNKNHVEHWLNGEKVVEYEYGSDTWKKQLAASKFTKWAYATPHTKGKIAFQDHDHRVEFRNLKIKTL